MIDHRPHIHLFNIYQQKYLYDVNTNAIMNISDKISDYLHSVLALPASSAPEIMALTETLDPEEKEDLQFIMSQGFLQDINDNIVIRHGETDSLASLYKSNLNMATLQVTQNCNLRCKYCVYSGSYINRTHNNKRMSLETAIKAIDFLYGHSWASEDISVGFYGGEPLLEYELIKECVSHAENIFAGKKLTFNMTTNATLLDEEKIRFLEKHQFNLTISLDGPRDIQNKNRIFAGSNKGTFDTIMAKLELVKLIAPDYIGHITFNAVIDINNDITCASEYFMSYDLVKEIGVSGNYVESNNLKDGQNEVPPEFFAHSQYEIFKIYLNSCTDLLKGYRTSLFSFQLDYLHSLIAERFIVNNHDIHMSCPGGQCLPGIQRMFINVDGKIFPCERVNEASEIMCIGDIQEGFNMDHASRLLNVSQITGEECKRCWCFKLCELCCGKAEKDGELDKQKRLSFCYQTKARTEDSMRNYIILKKYRSKLVRL